MLTEASWAHIFFDSLPGRVMANFVIRDVPPFNLVHILRNPCRERDGDCLQVKSLAQPGHELLDSEVVSLLLDKSVGGEVVPFGFVVTEGVDAVTEEAEDMFEDFGVGIDEVGAVGLLVGRPAFGNLGSEHFAAGKSIFANCEALLADLEDEWRRGDWRLWLFDRLHDLWHALSDDEWIDWCCMKGARGCKEKRVWSGLENCRAEG